MVGHTDPRLDRDASKGQLLFHYVLCLFDTSMSASRSTPAVLYHFSRPLALSWRPSRFLLFFALFPAPTSNAPDYLLPLISTMMFLSERNLTNMIIPHDRIHFLETDD